MPIKFTSKIKNNIHPLDLNNSSVLSFTRSFSDEILKDQSIFKVSRLKTGSSKGIGTAIRLKSYLENSSYYIDTITKMIMGKNKYGR